jgi:hypothetical protein
MRKPDWSEEEFRLLLDFPDDTAEHLQKRSPDAISIVKTGVHEFHQGRDSQLLSEMMKRLLSESNWTCPICNTEH